MSSGCSPKSFISDDEILPGFASAINVIALLRPIVKSSSTFSSLAYLLSHLRYGPNLPEFTVISFPFSGCCPKTFGSEHKYLDFSKSI